MNKITKITLAVLGGIEVIFYILIPTLVALMWIGYTSGVGVSAKVLISAGIISTIFRAIKVGWLVE